MIEVLTKRPALTLAVGISTITAAGLLALFLFKGSIGQDFGVYWRAASEPLAQVYQPRPALNFPYPPTMLIWISPLKLVPLWPAYVMFIALSLWAIVATCRKHLSGSEIALAIISPPMFYALLNGQVSVILTAALLLACMTQQRGRAGVIFAIVASIKPQLVLLAPLMLLAKKDWRALMFAGLTFFAFIVASVVAFGIETWMAWLSSLEHFHEILLKNDVLYVAASPAGVAEHWGLPPIPFLILGVVFGSWLAIKCRDLPPLETGAAIATGSLLAAPYALIYDLTIVVPYLVWAVFRGSLAGAFALSGALNPAPLLLTSLALLTARKDL